MTKRIAVFALVAMTWTGGIWIAYWAGFTHELSIATYQATLSDRVQLQEQKILLAEVTAGHIDGARQNLEDRVLIGEKVVKVQEDTPEIGPMDIMLAGFHPREFIELVRVARASRERESSSKRPSG